MNTNLTNPPKKGPHRDSAKKLRIPQATARWGIRFLRLPTISQYNILKTLAQSK